MKENLESLKVLKSEILDSLQQARGLARKLSTLEPQKISSATSEHDLILIGYYLSGLYSTFEEIFLKVAKEFENKIEDPTKWHAELLHRMALEIQEVRPAVISKRSRQYLYELLKFRNVFRYSYAFELQWDKMALVVQRWQEGHNLIYKDLQLFIKKLDQMAST